MIEEQKRKVRRVPIRKRIKLGYKEPIHLAYTTDFSEDGIAIETQINFDVNSIVTAEMYLDDKEPIRFKGEIIRISDEGSESLSKSKIGLKITNVSIELQRYYKNVLDKHKKQWIKSRK